MRPTGCSTWASSHDIRYMLRRHARRRTQRQSMLFSATLSQRVLELAYEHMNSPELVRIEPDKVTADQVRQLIYFPAMEEKIPLLIGLLRQAEAHRTMVFVNTRRMAERLEEVLRANGINAQAISGDVPQNKRLRYLKEFHSGELAVLIATDVASRGLHIPDVSHVYNFDLPQDCCRLRAPHRPHGARRRRRRCDQFRLRGLCGRAAGHRGLYRPQDPGRLDLPGNRWRTTWPSPSASRARMRRRAVAVAVAARVPRRASAAHAAAAAARDPRRRAPRGTAPVVTSPAASCRGGSRRSGARCRHPGRRAARQDCRQ